MDSGDVLSAALALDASLRPAVLLRRPHPHQPRREGGGRARPRLGVRRAVRRAGSRLARVQRPRDRRRGRQARRARGGARPVHARADRVGHGRRLERDFLRARTPDARPRRPHPLPPDGRPHRPLRSGVPEQRRGGGRRPRRAQLVRRGADALRAARRGRAGGLKRRQPSVMRFTVAICTWNRAALLPEVLGRLARARPPAGGWELLVVNNNSTDDTERVLDAFAGRLPLRRAFEQRQGLSHARNTAVKEATGEYLVWTDDDALVEAG